MSQNQIPVTDVSSQGHGGCGCGCSSVQDELPRLDARPFPPKLRHAAILVQWPPWLRVRAWSCLPRTYRARC